MMQSLTQQGADPNHILAAIQAHTLAKGLPSNVLQRLIDELIDEQLERDLTPISPRALIL